MDQTDLASFLRRRREVLQPDDVGIPRGQRRRTPGLRREEIAVLCGMSTDYYSRLERGKGPQPSVLDRLDDTPAQVVTGTGETIIQTRLAVALLGDQTHFTGPARSIIYRWFTDPSERSIYPPDEHSTHSRVYVAHLRGIASREGRTSPAAALSRRLSVESPEFAELWAKHEVGLTYAGHKTIAHPQVGTISLHCQILVDPDQSQSLLVYTAIPGSEDSDKLRLLSVIGSQQMEANAGS